MRTKKNAIVPALVPFVATPAPAIKLDELDMLRLQNLTLRAEALNNERVAFGVSVASKYFPGRQVAAITLSPDGTVSIPPGVGAAP